MILSKFPGIYTTKMFCLTIFVFSIFKADPNMSIYFIESFIVKILMLKVSTRYHKFGI